MTMTNEEPGTRRITTDLDEAMVNEIDDWAKRQNLKLTRSAAIRMLIARALDDAKTADAPKVGGGRVA